MADMDYWLCVIGGFGVSYGLHRWWKANNKFLAILEVAPDIDIDDLKQVPSLTTAIDYATVRGLVQTNDSKPYSVLKSQFLPDCIGVIHRLTIHEQKLKKVRDAWTETTDLISDLTRHVPFRLVSSNGNFVRIDKPLEFSSITDRLVVTHNKFDPNITPATQTFIDTLIGSVSKGIKTKEQMLVINVPLTGVGRLEKRSGIWYLIPHEQWGGILTRLSRNEILSDYRERSSLARFFSIFIGIAASCTAVYLIYQYYSKQQRQTNRLPSTAPPIQRNEENNQTNLLPPTAPPMERNEEDNQTNRLQCIICLENEVMYSLRPCSHLGLCHKCAQLLQRNHEQELCPICRTPIQEYQRVFLT